MPGAQIWFRLRFIVLLSLPKKNLSIKYNICGARYARFRVLITPPDMDESILCRFEFLASGSRNFLAKRSVCFCESLLSRKIYFSITMHKSCNSKSNILRKSNTKKIFCQASSNQITFCIPTFLDKIFNIQLGRSCTIRLEGAISSTYLVVLNVILK